jgi:hypothetical protein
MKHAETWLVLLLRLCAAGLLLALVAVFLPFRWMARINDWIGLDPLVDTPLMNYLTRSLSALYAFVGLLTWTLSTDIRRYRPLIVCLGVSYLVSGAALLILDFTVGMPLAWAVLEGPVVMGTGALQLWLVKHIAPVQLST